MGLYLFGKTVVRFNAAALPDFKDFGLQTMSLGLCRRRDAVCANPLPPARTTGPSLTCVPVPAQILRGVSAAALAAAASFSLPLSLPPFLTKRGTRGYCRWSQIFTGTAVSQLVYQAAGLRPSAVRSQCKIWAGHGGVTVKE